MAIQPAFHALQPKITAEMRYEFSQDDAREGYTNGTSNADSYSVSTPTGEVFLNLRGGDDTAFLYGSAKYIVHAGSGADRVRTGTGDDFVKAGSGHDTVTTSDGNDTVDGGSGNDVIDGGRDDDHLLGGTGNDRLIGGLGADSLSGGDGNDELIGDEHHNSAAGARDPAGTNRDALFGGAGNDILTGLAGRDDLTGGDHADTFRFLNVSDSAVVDNTASGGFREMFADRVLDFDAGEGDRIELSYIDALSGVAGDQGFDFVEGPSTEAGTVWIEQGRISYHYDLDGEAPATAFIVNVNVDGGAVDMAFQVRLSGSATGLFEADFIL
jgi:Ca2+-binding RTX toxin-like protein